MIETSKKWYGVRLWFTWAGENEEPSHAEERVLLVKSVDEDQAVENALRVASEVRTFQNAFDEKVEIRLKGVGSAFCTQEERLHSGVEVFSRLYELDDNGEITPEWIEGRVDVS